MKKLISGLILVSVLLVGMIIPAACSDEDKTNDVGSEPGIAGSDEIREGTKQTDSNDLAATSSEAASYTRLIIYNGDISIVVADISTSLDEIARLADKYQGYMVSSNISGEDYEMRGWISIRVPAEDFETAL